MAKKKNNDLCFGGWLVAAGCLVRTIQLIGAFFGAGFISNKWLYISMLCLLCGGFAVICYEKRGRASFFAMAAAATSLLSTVMGNMSSGSDGLRTASAVFLVLTFVFAGLVSMFTSNRKSIKILCGGVLVILAFACGAFAFGVSAHPFVTLLVLIASYALTGTMMII